MSFIPVREAIAQLAIEGLVRHEAGVGTYAARVDDEELRELYDLRAALELHALETATPKLEALDLVALRRANEALRALTARRDPATEPTISDADRRAEWETHDAEFHAVLVRRAENARLRTTLEAIRSRTMLYATRLPAETRELRLASCKQHDEVIEALTSGRPGEARTRLAAHLEHEYRGLLARRGAVDVR